MLGELHGTIIAVLAVVIIYSDHQAYLYFRGKKQLLSLKVIHVLHSIIWWGLFLMITTGVILLIPRVDRILQEPVFYVKMGLVAVLIFNGLAIGTLAKVAATTPYAQLTKSQQKTLLVSGALSAIGWLGAWFIGFALL